MSELKSALLGGLIASAVGVFAQYAITYKMIEQPKIDLEKKRIAIEAQKQILSFTPNVTTSCSAKRIDKFTWNVSCQNCNNSLYSILSSIEGADIAFQGDQKEKTFSAGSVFKLDFPNNHTKHIMSPGIKGNLNFYIRFDKNGIPENKPEPELFVIVNCKYDALNSTREYMESVFPEAKLLINEVSTFQEKIWARLPLEYSK